MHDKEAGMTSLRVIEARTFVCVETHTKNRKGQSLGREATQTQPQQQVLPHLQCRKEDRRGKPERQVHGNSQCVWRIQEDERHLGELEERAYTNDVVDYTLFLGSLMLGSSTEPRETKSRCCVKRSRLSCVRMGLKASPRRRAEHQLRKHELRPPRSPVA